MVTLAISLDLVRQIIRHGIDDVGQFEPHARDVLDVGLCAEDAVCADLFGDAGDFFGECAKTVDHFVDGGFDGGDFGEAGGEADALG